MKKILSFLIVCNLLAAPVFAAEELPALPANLPSIGDLTAPQTDVFAPSATPAQVAPKAPVQQAPVQQTAPKKPVQYKPTAPVKQKPAQKPINNNKNAYYKSNLKNSIVLKSGKKFTVKLNQSISDKTPEGAAVSFVSLYPETSTYVTIPAGTVFKGRIKDSHVPYLAGNGGLIVIEANQMIYNGTPYKIDAKISVANGKRIFLNNIKGKRMYFQSIPKAMKPGSTFFKKMWKVTCSLARNESGVEIILTPFSLLTGTLVYAVNVIASPVLALFYKGKSITIPPNSQFTIQLRDDVYLMK